MVHFRFKKEAFGAIQIHHSGVVKKIEIEGKFISPIISILSSNVYNMVNSSST